jgi:hypothetical protein
MWKWKLICWLIRKLTRGDGVTRRLLSLRETVDRELGQLSDRWITLNVRLKRPLPPVEIAATAARVGVVIQGKVKTDGDFTLRTVEHYRNSFSGCPLFVSTWNTESGAVVRNLEAAGAEVILNERPDHPGSSHINYQIRSTIAGIEAAKSAGCAYVLKTRTDARMYASNIPDYLAGLIEQFSPPSGCGVRGRLAVLDWATRLFLPQHPSDMMVFGRVEDMWAYWDAPLCESPGRFSRADCTRYDELLNPLVPEIYLCRNYLRKLNYPFEETLASWWQILADLFIVVDRVTLEHFWPKYNFDVEHHNSLDDHRRNEAVCGFREWLGIMYARKRPNFEVTDLLETEANGLLTCKSPKSRLTAA